MNAKIKKTSTKNKKTKKSLGASANNVIALPSGLSKDSAGAVVWWHLSGDVNADVLETAWIEHGLDPEWLPSLPSAKVALTRAVDDVITGNKARKKHRISDANWLVYEVKADENGSEYEELFRVALDEHKAPKFTGISEGRDPLVSELRASFHRHKARLEARDIGTWLSTKMLDRLDAVSLRNRGGIYFVHRDSVGTFQAIRKALKKASGHIMFEMQALKSDEAVEAILFSLTAEAQAQAVAVEADLDAHDEALKNEKKTFGSRALKTRHDQCERMIEKVQVYEKLLDKSLYAIRARLENLMVASMEAAMIADSNKE